ncbi:DNA repair protein RadC [Candidatus Aerophobetes bacterium]|nr:DNA repair protein RadC [Candidatus Aerophobetes bacterium]
MDKEHSKRSFTIRDLPISERPRERLLKYGPETLSLQEILALILGRGISGESVLVTAQRILNKFRNLKDLASASLEELSKIKGVGLAKASQIKAAFELGRRKEDSFYQYYQQKRIKIPEDAVNLVKSRLKGKKKEYFLVLLLSVKNQLLNIVEISKGSLDSNIVHPREVFKEAISASAASCIFIHNHPSGDPTPSEEDIQLTRRLKEAGEIIGIDVLDHIIVTDLKFVSLKEKTLL